MTDLGTEFRLTITPDDPDGSKRAARLVALGALPEAVPEYDDVAKQIIEMTGATWAGVNFVGEEQNQFFPGIAGPGTESVDGADPEIGREMPGNAGYCVHVVAREKAMALNNVMDYSRFATNPVVDALGIRSYIGAPLVDQEGATIGTVWAIDNKTHSWTQEDVDRMKGMAAKVMRRIIERNAERHAQ
ncbi:GAF domain-containing protein [Glycomyces buryatensis]|uniref:GAF domain-containing protein n=1 Tax=Glycomyces buryatensis TaxID=2570927 RepID=A0A4S8QGH8_9ACTN|nr:GAF domain-containing protein [Glycomyces buryatensis]THV42282.1 GAF domain-containing protein [Glycomyces buryatensis]